MTTTKPTLSASRLYDILSISREVLNREIAQLEFKIKYATQNRLAARKDNDQKRLSACDNSILINEVSMASLKWVLQIMAWQEEEENLEAHIEAEKAKALQVAREEASR
jgi:hypothetical protein